MEQQVHKHFKMHKPFGYLSQFVTNDVKPYKKKLLSELYNFPEGIMSVGRLDEKSEGLLLLTTDGKLSDTINRSGVEKEYFAQLDGIITSEAISKLETGVEIGFSGKKYITKPCNVSQIDAPDFPERSKKLRDERHGPTCWISICITEGKFRQIRKMTAAVGYPTLRLVRMRIGTIELNDMKAGDILPLSEFESV
ncbi:23S rRNA pseudouridine2457 synthase [Ulvibacter sp. MAR_2010_11]|uniref:pseudouridine synthase n=1 Tax=Ulvibacter sp. MAR_2010_11 TaxID=1250229 RepID=UPI000C2C4C35|nr:pseudouridine synthase [Ulvibacter sp. MAR_2010_11]PKA84134.1 23S rRNA pseudouridine2457 synthase [Ulvibacter sp. MAR_2010_11]